MLVLSRKPGERIVLNNGIVVTVVSCRGGRVRLALEAPREIPIRRGELKKREEGSKANLEAKSSPLPLRVLSRWRQACPAPPGVES
jgi:carbon storage regulator